MKNGAEQARASTRRRRSSTPSPRATPAQAKLIDNAVTQKVDGIVVSMANPDALRRRSSARSTPASRSSRINSGGGRSSAVRRDRARRPGGGDRRSRKPASKLKEAGGKTKLLCVIHEAGNIGLNQRCDGAKAGFGGTVENLQVDINNPTDVESRIKGALQTDTSIDARARAQPAGRRGRARPRSRAPSSKAKVATFDLNADVVTADQGRRDRCSPSTSSSTSRATCRS